jgi:hypothetical protein
VTAYDAATAQLVSIHAATHLGISNEYNCKCTYSYLFTIYVFYNQVALHAAVASIDDALYFAERALANRANVAPNSAGTSAPLSSSGSSGSSSSSSSVISGGVPSAHSNESLSPTAAMDVASYMR